MYCCIFAERLVMITIYRGAQYEGITIGSDSEVKEVRLFNPTTKEYKSLINYSGKDWKIEAEDTKVLTPGSYTLEIYGNSKSGTGIVMLSSIANFAKVSDSSMPYTK